MRLITCNKLALLVAMLIPMVTWELVSNLSVSFLLWISIHLHFSGDSYYIPKDIPQVYL